MLITAFIPNDTHAPMLAYLPDPQRPSETPPWLWPGGQTHPPVAAPPQIQQRTVGQESPWHPLPQGWWSGDQTHQNVAAPPQSQRLQVAQEQPTPLPTPQAWSGDQTHQNVAAPPQRQSTRVTQEPPWHPGPLTATGRRQQNVAAPPQVRSAALVGREEPWQPDPQKLWRGAPLRVILPYNVAAPPQIQQRIQAQREDVLGHPLPFVRASVMAQTSLSSGFGVGQGASPGLSLAQTQPASGASRVVGLAQANSGSGIAGAFVAQDLTWHPDPQTMPGVRAGVGAQSSIVECRGVVIAQEMPYHPTPRSRVAIAPATVRPERRAAAVAQEQPGLPAPQVGRGIQGPNVAAPPQIGELAQTQAQPYHPSPATLAGLQQQQNVVSPAQVATVGGVRVEPWHPAPLAPPRLTPANAHAPSQMARAVSAQESPWHPLPSAAAGVPGPNVRTIGGDFAAVGQEMPWHPLPVAGANGPGSPPTRRGIGDFALIAQEQPPPLPVPLVKQWAPGFRIASRDWATTSQEQPYQPLPSVGASPQTQTVMQPFGAPSSGIVRQEQPGQSPNGILISIQGPNVLAPVSEIIIVPRADPWHPLSSAGASPQTQNIALGIGRSWATAQESPWHPGLAPRQVILPSTPTLAPPGRRTVTVGQEPPWHPGPLTGMACTVYSPVGPGLPGLDLVAPERLLASPGRVRTLSQLS